jgi:hypothetical protein
MKEMKEILHLLGLWLSGVGFGFSVGLWVAQHRSDLEAMGSHSYHLAAPISFDGHVLVRRVQSPCSIDDGTIETIIDSKLVSRSKVKQ